MIAMLFNSYIFIFLFLPLCMIGWYVLNHFGRSEAAKIFLAGMSLWFYGSFHVMYLTVIAGSIAMNYGFYLLSRKRKNGQDEKLLKTVAVLLNLMILGYFKYFNFFAENINSMFHLGISERNILLPLGISFFTFQQIAFVIDAFNGEVRECNLIDYVCFVTFFPKIAEGPIATHDELLPQFASENEKKFAWKNFYEGICLFTFGLAKKVLLADVFGKAANLGFSYVQGLNATDALISMTAYTVEIYFDFSGYCDMACGIAKLFGFELPMNFNSPYKSVTIVDFWKRWHMTLTRFFTKYIYIPLGGSYKGKARTMINVMVVFLVSGLWHGAGWNFIFWGAMHGAFSVLTRLFRRFFEGIPKILGRLITFIFVNIAWVFFRAKPFSDAVILLKKIFTFRFCAADEDLLNCFCLPEIRSVTTRLQILLPEVNFTGVVAVLWFVFAFFIIFCTRNAWERVCGSKPTALRCVVIPVILMWCMMALGEVSAFLYFNF